MTRRHLRLALCALLLAPALATARRNGPPIVVVPGGIYNGPVTTDCWIEPHYFDSLRNGPVEYCRKNLRYKVGALECLSFIDRVCTTWFPDRNEWGETRSSNESRLIRCPDGEPPPTCPRLRLPGWR